jgi:hypothetical protein
LLRCCVVAVCGEPCLDAVESLEDLVEPAGEVLLGLQNTAAQPPDIDYEVGSHPTAGRPASLGCRPWLPF